MSENILSAIDDIGAKNGPRLFSLIYHDIFGIQLFREKLSTRVLNLFQEYRNNDIDPNLKDYWFIQQSGNFKYTTIRKLDNI